MISGIKYHEAVAILVEQQKLGAQGKYLGLTEERWQVIIAAFGEHLNQPPHVPMADPDFSLEEIEQGQEVIDNLK